MIKSIIALTLAFAFLTGCSVLSTVAEDQNQLAVQYATLKVLERDDVSNERVLELVAKAKTYIQTSETVAVSALVDEARAKLTASSISPADQLLIEVILSRAQERIEAKLGDGILAKEQRVQLLTVLNWIEQAASI